MMNDKCCAITHQTYKFEIKHKTKQESISNRKWNKEKYKITHFVIWYFFVINFVCETLLFYNGYNTKY